MPGLIGVVDTRDGAPSERAFSRMRKAAVHSGRTRGAWRAERAVLGWAGSSDAAFHEDDQLVITLDGWLRFGEGAPARAAAVAVAWAQWGIDLVRYADGEFALAVYEKASGVLHLVRDASGCRPLLYARAPGRIAFASDPAPLLELPWVGRVLQRDHLAEYLAFRVVHAPRTLLRDVHQVPPGHRLRFGGDSVRVVRWHEPTYAAPGTAVPREADVVPELTAAMERAVQRRLLVDERVGIYLSGGVGSTSLVAAARSASQRLQTFTVAFAEEPFPESPFAGRVAQLLGMDHHVVTVGSKDVAERFDDAVRAAGMPNGNIGIVLQLLLAEEAARHVDTVLTGDGTDQLFGGAMLELPARGLRRSQFLHRLPFPLRTAAGNALRALGRGTAARVPPERWGLVNGVGGVTLFDVGDRQRLLLDESLVQPGVRAQVLTPFYDDIDSDPLNEMLHAFFMSSLVADTLPRVEATASAAGLQAGFPLLDGEVRRLAQVLPGGFKAHGVSRGDLPTRWLLRAALRGAIPAALVNRPDRGMPRPLDDWLTGAGRLFMEERFAVLRADPLALFHTTALEALRRGLGRTPGASQRLWSLLILDAWVRQHKLS